MRTTALALTLVLAVTACADIDDAAPSRPVSARETLPAITPSPTPTTPGGMDDRRVYHMPEPITWSDPAGVQLRIHAVAINSRAFVADLLGEQAEHVLDPDTQSVFAMKIEARNDSGRAIDWYPNQGELVVGDEQVDAALFLSDDVAGSNWQDGVRKEGNVFWQLKAPLSQVAVLKSARFLVNVAHDADSFDSVGSPVDVTISWDGVTPTDE